MKQKVILILCVVLLLAGSLIWRLAAERSAEQTADDVPQPTPEMVVSTTASPEPTIAIQEDTPPDETPCAGVGDGSRLDSSDAAGNVLSYEVESWQVYESWETAGAEETGLRRVPGASEELGVFPDELPALLEGESVLMVTVSVTRQDGDGTQSTMAQTLALGALRAEEDGQMEEIRACFYFDRGHYEPDKTLEECWQYELPAKGDSMTVTLGFVLGETEREAAEQGRLVLLVPHETGEQPTEYLPLIAA